MQQDSKTFAGLTRVMQMGFNPSGILDIGAHDGDWSRASRLIFPSAYNFMIEALAEKAMVLEHTCRDIGNADYCIQLLGRADAAAVEFHVVDAGGIKTGSSLYKENTGFPVTARPLEQKTLSAVVGDVGARFQLVKLDVQGAELDILYGALGSLRGVDVVLMEVATQPYNEGAPLLAEVIRSMDYLGFSVLDIVDEIRFPNGTLFQLDVIFVSKTAPFRPLPPF